MKVLRNDEVYYTDKMVFHNWTKISCQLWARYWAKCFGKSKDESAMGLVLMDYTI